MSKMQEPEGTGFELEMSDSIFIRVLQRNRPDRFCVHREREIYLRNWFTHLWKLASPKSTGWTSSLEIQKRADVVV